MTKGKYFDDEETTKHLNAVIANPEGYPTVAGEMPIGAIVPVFPAKGISFRMPLGWTLCDGSPVVDDRSPFKGQDLPDLTGQTFLMGVKTDLVGSESGINTIPEDGRHTHTGSTGHPHNGHDACKEGDDRYPSRSDHIHTFTTSEEPPHNHGGDNRPKHLGVYFIIKIFDAS